MLKVPYAVTRAEAQGRLEVLDREIELAGVSPQSGAPYPTACKARVETKRTVDQPYGDIDVLPERPEHDGSIGEDVWVIPGAPETPPRQIDPLAAVCL
jgi:hypothetical protein